MATLTSSVNSQRDLALFQFTHGIDLDAPLAPFEVSVQKAWVNALLKCRLLTADETQRLHQALDEARELFVAGRFEWKVEDEDVHMNLERFLSEKLGELGKRIHLGR